MGLWLCVRGAACQIGGVFVKIPLIQLAVLLVIKVRVGGCTCVSRGSGMQYIYPMHCD